jgi:hypothetical protein
MKRNALRFAASLLLAVAAVACSSSGATTGSVRLTRIATRQLPPEPVYGRLRWVRPPEVMPRRGIPTTAAGLMLPVVHLQVDKAGVCEAAQIVGATVRYRTYCSSLIADKRVTLNMLGTLDELVGAISEESGAKIVVDHTNKEIRFVAGRYVEPRF